MTELTTIQYKDETDKCYGLAGMAVMLAVGEDHELLVGMDLDGDESLVFSHDFFFRGNPLMPAKYVWTQTLAHFRLAVGLMLANMMCRRYVGERRALERELAEAMRSLVRDEAGEQCALEADEADSLFDEAYDLSDRVFRHSGVRDIAREFANLLGSRRHLDASEIFEFMARRGLR